MYQASYDSGYRGLPAALPGRGRSAGDLPRARRESAVEVLIVQLMSARRSEPLLSAPTDGPWNRRKEDG